ncbi:unnamed protein product [Paramecium octaurelia]|uniref:Uncharacterized protein n=1 Tax=Paramecium octaurelia TaxID=43137 RepID=A0A8S1TNY8_PAROT|nr:unnamed protein product [Paramecium octaurelia]
MDQGFSQNQTGLLSNKSSQKYQEPQKDYAIEMQDMTDQQSYVLLTNEQTSNQTQQQQNMNKYAQPQMFNSNPHQYYQFQQLNQNQQQYVVPRTTLQNHQQYNNQQYGKKQNITHYAVCIFCRSPQSIADDKKPFMCYQCKQVQQANYDFFKCSHCKVTVKYQKGISSVIRCTKCNNHNFVQLQPIVQIAEDQGKI